MSKPDLFDPQTMLHWICQYGVVSYGFMLHQLGHGGAFGWSHQRIDNARNQLLSSGAIIPCIGGYTPSAHGIQLHGRP